MVHSYPCEYRNVEYRNGPRAAPTISDGKVYTLGTQGHLVCLDAGRGDVVWKKNLGTDWQGCGGGKGTDEATRSSQRDIRRGLFSGQSDAGQRWDG